MTSFDLDDELDDEPDEEDDEEFNDEEDEDDEEEEPETWQVRAGGGVTLKADLRLTSGSELPRLAAISQLIKRAGPNSAGPASPTAGVSA